MFWSWEGMGFVQDIISRPFNYTESHGCLKNLSRCILGIDGLREGGGGMLPSNRFWLTKKALALPIFNRMSLFVKVLRQQVAISKFVSDALWENMRFGDGGYLPPNHSESSKRILELLISNPASPLQSL